MPKEADDCFLVNSPIEFSISKHVGYRFVHKFENAATMSINVSAEDTEGKPTLGFSLNIVVNESNTFRFSNNLVQLSTDDVTNKAVEVSDWTHSAFGINEPGRLFFFTTKHKLDGEKIEDFEYTGSNGYRASINTTISADTSFITLRLPTILVNDKPAEFKIVEFVQVENHSNAAEQCTG
jgi:hypothetical protein